MSGIASSSLSESSRITRKDFAYSDQFGPSRVGLYLNRSCRSDDFQLLNARGAKMMCRVIVDERNEYVDPIFHQTSFICCWLLVDGKATTISFRRI
jgi:hypothetical protein